MEEAWVLYSEARLHRIGSKVGKMGLRTLTQREIGAMLRVSQQSVSRYYNRMRRECARSFWSGEDDATSEIASLRRKARSIVRL